MAKAKKISQNQLQQEAHDALVPQTIPKVDNSRWRCLDDWNEVTTRQTSPPTIPAHHNWLPGNAPVSQIWEYSSTKTTEEKMEVENTKQIQSYLQDYRRAAEAHRLTRRHIQSYIQPGMSLYEIAEEIERVSQITTGAKGLRSGRGFPTGLSLNHIAAHYTPNPGEKKSSPIFTENDIMKVDFGTHVNGRIIDCAFSLAMNEQWDPLLLATKEATNAGLKLAGPDADFGELATAMGEVISSHEVEIKGKILPVLPIRNLNGHTMEPYLIHAGKSLPFHKCKNSTRMVENEVYAIETFASVGGIGFVEEGGDCSHYMMPRNIALAGPEFLGLQSLPSKSSKELFTRIQSNFGSLAFCRRWLTELNEEPHGTALHQLCRSNVVTAYPPLVETNTEAMTSQFEHTVWLRPNGKEVLSRGDDY